MHGSIAAQSEAANQVRVLLRARCEMKAMNSQAAYWFLTISCASRTKHTDRLMPNDREAGINMYSLTRRRPTALIAPIVDHEQALHQRSLSAGPVWKVFLWVVIKFAPYCSPRELSLQLDNLYCTVLDEDSECSAKFSKGVPDILNFFTLFSNVLCPF